MTKADYGQALTELEDLHRAGKISDGRYELHKQQMLAGAQWDSNPLVRFGRRLWTVAAVAALLLVAFGLVWLFT